MRLNSSKHAHAPELRNKMKQKYQLHMITYTEAFYERIFTTTFSVYTLQVP